MVRQPNITPILLQEYVSSLSDNNFTVEKVLKIAEEWKQMQVHTVTISALGWERRKSAEKNLDNNSGGEAKILFQQRDKRDLLQ